MEVDGCRPKRRGLLISLATYMCLQRGRRVQAYLARFHNIVRSSAVSCDVLKCILNQYGLVLVRWGTSALQRLP